MFVWMWHGHVISLVDSAADSGAFLSLVHDGLAWTLLVARVRVASYLGCWKRASSFKGTLEQARLAGLTDEEIASIAVALKPVLVEEEKSGDSGRSMKRGVLPEACSSQTIKRGKAVLEPSSNPERVTPVKHGEYCAHDHLTQAGSTSTPATVTVPSTESSTTATTQTAVTITRTRKPTCNPVLGFWMASANSRSGRNAACADA